MMTTYKFANQELVWLCNQKHEWLPTFSRIFNFFSRGQSRWNILTNKHLFILDGHGSHDTFKAIEWTVKFIWIWSLYLHIHHMHFNFWMWVVSSLSKILLKGKETTMLSRNYIEPNKITLARCDFKKIFEHYVKGNG